ncbi:MAG TPA: LuxR C-terminal-related transcriptional regulator [Cytophagales bacterium]|nr:LuxR C-terminal-related transcriptional regulator [Cytophagales bacterium]
MVSSFDEIDGIFKAECVSYESLLRDSSFQSLVDHTSQILLVYNPLTGHQEFMSSAFRSLSFSRACTLEKNYRSLITSILDEVSSKVILEEFIPMVKDICKEQPLTIPSLQFKACVQMRNKNWAVLQNFILAASDDGEPILSCIHIEDITVLEKRPVLQYSAHKLHNGVSEVLMSKMCHVITKEQASLSRREREVLRLLCSGKTSKDIAAVLYISYETVKKHRQNILDKTGCSNRVELINFATAHAFNSMF